MLTRVRSFGSLHQLEETHGKLPATMRVETPSGGRHINFRNPAGVRLFNRAGDILPGIDIRGNGGQVLAPGSMRANGKIYRQLDDDFDTLADPPKWLLFLGMFNKNQRERLAARGILCAADFGDLPPQRWAEKARELLKPASARSGPAGELSDARKAALVRYVNTAVEAELEKLVTEAAQGHRDNDLQKAATICVSLVYGLRDTGVDDHEFEEDVFDKLCSAGSMLSRGEEFGEENVRGKWERLVDAVDRGTVTPRDLFHVGLDARERASADEEFADIGVKSRLEFCRDISLAEIAKRRKLALVEGLTMPGDVGGLYGHPGTGKSFLGCDLSFHVALGKEWHGKRVTRAPVLYLPLEGRDGFRKRTKAAELKHGDPGDWFAIQRAHVLLAKGKAGEEGIAEVIASAKELEAKCGQPVGLVIIDTYARAIAGDDENTTCEAMAYLEKRAGEIQRRTGAAVLTLYHPNKQGGFRGASAQPAGLDFILRIDRNGSRRTLRVEKVKDGEDGVALFDFELATVELPGTEGEMSCTTLRRSRSGSRSRAEAGQERRRQVPCFDPYLIYAGLGKRQTASASFRVMDKGGGQKKWPGGGGRWADEH